MNSKLLITLCAAALTAGYNLNATTYGFKNTVAQKAFILDIMTRSNQPGMAGKVTVNLPIGRVSDRSEADAIAKGDFDIIGFELRDEKGNYLKKIEWNNRERGTRNFKIVNDNNPTVVEWKD